MRRFVIGETGRYGAALEAVLRAAARRLPERVPGAQVFLEDRVQARISASASGSFEQTSLRLVGAALDGGRSLHLTDPPVSNLTGGSEDTVLSGLLPAPVLPLERWGRLVRELAGNGVTARVVAFHQNVWVVDRGGARVDSRRAARIELQSATDPGVVLDRVVSETAPPPSQVLGDRVRDRARERAGAVTVDPGRDGPPAIFGPGLGGVVVHELVGHALEGDVAASGSRLARVTEPFASRGIRVIDDPARGRAAWTIDDEGTTPRPVTLLEAGRVVGRLHDRRSGREGGSGSTGHGRRGGYLDPILPRMGCTFIERGTSDPGEILRETRRGIFIRRLVAAHADPFEGRATFIVTDADRIEEGRATHPLRPFVMELDAIDALASLDRIGDDLEFDTCVGSCVRAGQPLAVSVGAPTVRIGVITVIL